MWFFFQIARYLTHYSSWGVLSAYSPQYGYPFGSVVSISDGLMKNSSGTPYMYLSDNGDTHHHLKYNNSAGLTLTMSESEICRRNGLDPLEPLCARMVLLGKVSILFILMWNANIRKNVCVYIEWGCQKLMPKIWQKDKNHPLLQMQHFIWKTCLMFKTYNDCVRCHS